ncbi:MAG TPA: signal peptidase I [Planctomycetaceae bacterium]|nr:signal peptidase I [Planctomycetaceae bacterium]
MCCFGLFYLLIIVLVIAGMWKVFVKAGKPGWAAIVPIYNMYVLTEISGKEILWFILTFIPCVNLVALVMICISLAERFGKGAGYGIGLALLSPIFFPMLGFSDARYTPGKG